MKKKPIQFRGKLYTSIAAAARANGLQPNTLHKAKYEGRLDTVGKSPNTPKTPVRLNDIDFPSINDAAKYFSVHRTTITRALNKGTNELDLKGVEIIIDGHKFDSISAAARHYGVTRHKIYKLRAERKLNALAKKPSTRTACMVCKKPITHGTHMCDSCRSKSSGLA